MTREEQIIRMRLEILNDINDDSLDDIFNEKLDDAKWIALNTLYPFRDDIDELPFKYENWQVRCAIELYGVMGQEGYITYSENGLSYTKASGLISKDLMSELTPHADIPR